MEETNVINVAEKSAKKYSIAIVTVIMSMFLALTLSYTIPTIGKVNGTFIVAKADSPKDAFNKLQGSKGGVLGNEVKTKVTSLGADIQSLVLSVVMAILTTTTLWTSTKFTGAGENPQAKAALKNALMFQIGGIAFLASYSGLVLFGLNNLNMF